MLANKMPLDEEALYPDFSWRGKKRIAAIISATIEINHQRDINPHSMKAMAVQVGLSHPCVGSWAKGIVRSPRRDNFKVPKRLARVLYVPEAFFWKQTPNGPVIHEVRLYPEKRFDRDWKALVEIGTAEECALDRDFFDPSAKSGVIPFNKVKKTPDNLADLIQDQVVKHRISLVELSALVGGPGRFQALMDGNLPLTSDQIRRLAVLLKSSEGEVRGLMFSSLGGRLLVKENIFSISDAINSFLDYMQSNNAPGNWTVGYMATHFVSEWGFNKERIFEIIEGAECKPEELNYLEDLFRRYWIAWSYEELCELNNQQEGAINKERHGDRNGVI